MPDYSKVETQAGAINAAIQKHNSSSSLMVETLESGLSQLRNQPVRISELQREVCPFVSSFLAEHLRVLLDTGESVPVFFKDMNPHHQVKTAQIVRGDSMAPSYHELHVYQQILAGADLGTPQLYAVRWEPDKGIFWFFFEDVGNSRLRDSRNFQRWIPAARWAARFHAATRNLSPSQTSFLPVWDLAHYSRLADRISGILAELDAKDRTIVAEALEHYVSRISWFATLPKTVIHGQFFGKNIMVRGRGGDRTLAVIDWETTALGPGSFDLVSISFGKWTEEQRLFMWRTYFEEYQARTALSLSWKEFCAEFREMEIYQALEWVGWWRNRSVSHNFGKWIKELTRVIKDRRRHEADRHAVAQ